jgi:hypothetical protein
MLPFVAGHIAHTVSFEQLARLQVTGATTTNTWSNYYTSSSNGSSPSSSCSSQLALPEQQMRVVKTFCSYVSTALRHT